MSARATRLVGLARMHEALARSRAEEAAYGDPKARFDAKASADAHRMLVAACYAAMAREIEEVTE